MHPNSCVGYNHPLAGSQCSAEGFLLPLVGKVRESRVSWASLPQALRDSSVQPLLNSSLDQISYVASIFFF